MAKAYFFVMKYRSLLPIRKTYRKGGLTGVYN